MWKEFDPIRTNDKLSHAKCIHYNKVFVASRSSGTSQCLRHLKVCKVRLRMHHLIEHMHANLSPTADVMKNWKFDQEVSRKELLRMIVLQELPFSIVEHVGFRRFVASLNPYFKVISRTTLRNDCMAAYEDHKLALFDVLKSSNSRVSLTADMWTSIQNLGYLCVTCHYIDNEWKLQKRIIKFALVPTPHDGITMFSEMLKAIQEWHIENKLFSVTLDNASVNDTMMTHLKTNLVGKTMLPCDGVLLHFRCAAHIFNLIVQDGLKTMSNAINSIRESVKYVRSSQSRGQRFEEMIAQVGIKTNRRPSLDVSTRWNSTYLMLDSSLLVRMAFEALDRHDINYLHQPFDYQWTMAEKLCALLKVFYEATVAVSGTLYPTSTCYFHELWKIKMVLDKEATNEDVTIASIVKEMKEKFKKYWDAQYLQICFPVIFDPRYKYKFIEFRLKSAFGAAATPYLKEIKSNMQKLFDEYSAKYGGSNNINSQPETSVEQNVDASNQFADWRQFLHDKSRSKVKSELSRYLADMPQEGDFQDGHDFDILNWWMVNKTKYPVISRMARDVLAIPATSVASEAAFSTGERIISDYRSRLSSSTVEALICLQDWMRAEGLGDFFARDLAESDDQNVQHSGI